MGYSETPYERIPMEDLLDLQKLLEADLRAATTDAQMFERYALLQKVNEQIWMIAE